MAEELMGRNQAANYLRMDTRTFSRKVKSGEIDEEEPNKFSRATLDEYMASLDNAEMELIPEVQIVQELGSALKQAQDHNERLMQLLEKPMKNVLDTVEKTNSNLLERLEKQDDAHLQFMTALGEILLQKEERQATQAMAEARSEALRDAGKAAAKHIPTLLAQWSGKGGEALKQVSDFAESLNLEQKSGLLFLAETFEGEQKKQYLNMLKVLGIDPQKIAEEVEAEEKAKEAEAAKEAEGGSDDS